MAATTTAKLPAQHAPAPRGYLIIRRWVIACVALFLAAIVAYAIFLAVDWPFNEDALLGILQERSARSVTIDHFQRTYFPPGCIAEGINFLRHKHKDKPPIITIKQLVIQGSYTGMLRIRKRIPLVRVVGLKILVAPNGPGESSPIMPLTHPGAKKTLPFTMIIDKVIGDRAQFEFLRRNAPPFHLTIDKIRLDNVANDRAITYRTRLLDGEPPGIIQSSGVFGPWNPSDPASTPVRGTYTYSDVNLAFFKAISGTLSSTGSFGGKLGQMQITGKVDVPQFQVYDTSHVRRLDVDYHAVVNGTNGDTFLSQTVAHFDRTTVVVNGSVAGSKGEEGKLASFDFACPDGRVEDLFDLFISGHTPPMTGGVTFRAQATLPPGPQPFLSKLQMSGGFGVDGGKFTDRSTETGLTKLSESARKKPQADHAAESETVVSDLRGRAVIKQGVATLSDVSFSMPGAYAVLQGTYNLINYNTDLHGILQTVGQPADAVSGFKSFLLRVMTPFFKKKGKAEDVPFKITGTYGHTNIGLDLSAKSPKKDKKKGT